MELLMPTTRISVDEYEQMVDTGILTEYDRVELIRGEIVPKMPIGPKHAASVKRMVRLFSRRLGDTAIVGSQDPIRLIDSEPEPDITLLRPRPDFYASGHPRPNDILLIIEVADSSLDDDRNIMRPIYAEAGIAEFWIVNIPEEVLEVYRGPQPDGTYREVQTLGRGQSTGILGLPGFVVAVDDVL
jgi:Putative restriction endonuclease